MRKLPQYGRMTGCSFYATIYSRINIGTLLRNKIFNLKTTKCIFQMRIGETDLDFQTQTDCTTISNNIFYN